MIVAIHQPNYMPWTGYFYKMLAADTFVFLDDVPFSKGSYTNRVQIKGANGPQWLTIPIVSSGKLGQPINEVCISPNIDCCQKHVKSLQAAYARTTFFTRYFEAIADALTQPAERLADLNVRLVRLLAGLLGIATPIVFSSQLHAEGSSTQRLVSICRQLQASTYLSGLGARNYQEEQLFQESNIQVRMSDFVHPQYPQLFGDFVPGLSIVDLLFNCGPDGEQILRSAGQSNTG